MMVRKLTGLVFDLDSGSSICIRVDRSTNDPRLGFNVFVLLLFGDFLILLRFGDLVLVIRTPVPLLGLETKHG